MIHFWHFMKKYWWGASKSFIDMCLFWSVLCAKNRSKSIKIRQKILKTAIWSFSDTFWIYFWWILLKNKTSFHLRLISLISDHFDVFYKQKTDQKRAENSSKLVKSHPKSVISSHIHTRYGLNMASYGLFTYFPVIYHLYQPHLASYGLK